MSEKVLIDRELLKELVSSLEGEVESRYSNGIKDHPAMKRDYECDIEPVIRGKELLAAPAAPEQVEHERKLFEARMRRVAPGVNLEMIGDRYNELDTQWKFELWLDRAALAGKGATK